MSLRDLLASTRLLRLAIDVLEERRKIQEDANREAAWEAEARARLQRYMS